MKIWRKNMTLHWPRPKTMVLPRYSLSKRTLSTIHDLTRNFYKTSLYLFSRNFWFLKEISEWFLPGDFTFGNNEERRTNKEQHEIFILIYFLNSYRKIYSIHQIRSFCIKITKLIIFTYEPLDWSQVNLASLIQRHFVFHPSDYTLFVSFQPFDVVTHSCQCLEGI